ncbi:MAG: serine/threonine protein kinase, partial [Planctomycetales bacterium]|nr:serine/threonine protein kinase [Planctomycetales bacterium]
MSKSVQRFIELLRRSKLANRQQIEAVIDEIKTNHGGKVPSDASLVAQAFLDADVLTQWQCDKLRDGRYRGFFLDKYKLLRQIGRGGMSTVYLAEHTLMHRSVAVKVLPKHRNDDSSHLERFYLEAKAAAALDHPNIVRAYDVGQDGDTHFLVMEYIDGRDLLAIVRGSDSPLTYVQVASYIAQAARGLQHAHDAGLVHR